ncbi:MAG TPA: AMP-binding protein, partial [Gemmatimonadaceae bacterium]
MTEQSGHVDTFCAQNLPPRELWPVMDYTALPDLAYPTRLNCAAELLDATVSAGRGDSPVFLYEGTRWSYRDLLTTANQIAHVLVEDLAVVPGNRVLLRAPNTPMLAACWFAVLKAGGVVVSTMPLLRPREISYTADKARISLALTDSRVAVDCERAMLSNADASIRAEARVVHFNTNAVDGLESMMRTKPATFMNCDTSAEDIALIAFTSGTTGRAKGTMHTHRDVLAITDCFARHILEPDASDIFCGSPPLAFTYALGGLLLFPMRFGASTLMLEQASPPNLINAIQEHRPTICFTAPTAYRAMLGMLGDFDVSSLRKCVSAGETLPAATLEAWKAATGVTIIDGIGATEMLHIFISAAGDDVRPGATGRAIPGYQARIVDDAGVPLPVGEVGLLEVR